MSEFRKRILEPVSLPVFAALFGGVLVFAASRILLAVAEAASTIIALVIAAEILGVCAVLAAASRLKAAQRMLLILVGLSLVGGGAAGLKIGAREIEPHGHEIVVLAKDIKFSPADVHFTPDEPFTLTMNNQDAGVPHNINVYADETKSQTLFKTGDPVNGPIRQAHKLEEGLPAGIYPFVCDVHPGMTGRLVPGEGGEGAPAEGEGAPEPGAPAPQPSESPTVPPPSPATTTTSGSAPTAVDIAAKDLTFNLTEFTLAAGVTDTINFDNQDAASHNVVIYRSADFSGEPVFREDFFSGPKKVTWTFTGPEAGTYYFKCEVHPDMKGVAHFR